MNEWPRIVGLAGKMRSGKDTAAAVLTEMHGYERVAFGDTIKRVALDVNPLVPGGRLSDIVDAQGWELAKELVEVRRVLQAVGLALRNQWPSFWVEVLARQFNADSRYVITDVRFPGEVAMIQDAGGIVLRIERPLRDGVTNAADISETALDRFDLPTIVNDDTISTLHERLLATLDQPS